jgi:hypothetical protein
MKKVFLTMLMALVAMGAMAKDMPKSGFGLQVGWAQPTFRLNSPSTSYPKDSLVNTIHLNGFKVGLVYDVSYVAGFGSTVGLNYTFGGGHTNWTKKDVSHSVRTQTLFNELELFVDWQYKFEVAKETYLMLTTGPTLQCGLSLDMNKYERNDLTDDVMYNKYSAYKTDVENEHLTRLNITWGIGAGFQYKQYFLRGGYDFGLINPYANKEFVDALDQPTGRYTRGRLDQWSIRVGMYIWYK